MSNVAINIAAEFTGKKAFKEADTATQKLTKNVKKLAGAVGIAFGANAILAYSKASVRAFAEDEAAALRLNRAVTNLGIGFANPAINEYIANLEKSSNIVDDVLRPAFQGLLTTTGSLTSSQKLLNDAITISRASGIDLATVATDLGKGYVGITRGLVKYNTGLTQSELKTKSFNELLGIILARSAGAAEDYLKTTSYQMDALSRATNNASESLGKGLVAALARAGGGTEASDAVIFLETVTSLLNKVTLATGTVVGGFTNVFRTLKNLPKDIFMGFSRSQAGIIPKPKPAPAPPDPVNLEEERFQKLLAQLEKDALKRQKELNALKTKELATQKKLTADKKKQEALDKAALVLAQGQKVFDEEGIQLAAAAQGKLTEEEKTRLALKTDIFNLEAAINEGNVTAAAKLANSMVANAQKLAALRTDMIGLNDIQNPFTAWLQTLKLMAIELAGLTKTPPKLLPKGSTPAEIEAIIDEYLKLTPEDQTLLFGSPLLPKGSLPDVSNPFNEGPDAARFYRNMSANGSMAGGTSVIVNIAGSVSTERDLVAAITQGLYTQQASGTPVNYSTVY